MNYVAMAKTADLAPGKMKTFDVGGARVLLANVAGEFRAIQAKCPHMGAELCKGKLDDNIVICPKHSAAFDVRDGAAVDPAKLLFLKMKTKNAKSFPVKVEGDQILIAV